MSSKVSKYLIFCLSSTDSESQIIKNSHEITLSHAMRLGLESGIEYTSDAEIWRGLSVVRLWGNNGSTHTEKISQLVTSLQASPQQDLFALLVLSCQQVVPYLWQLVTSLTRISDLLQGCSNSSDTVLFSQVCHKAVTTLLYHAVSVLLEQSCNRSDSPIKLVTICQQIVPNLFQQIPNKQCEYILSTTSEQTCYNLFAGLYRLVRFYVCRWSWYSHHAFHCSLTFTYPSYKWRVRQSYKG